MQYQSTAPARFNVGATAYAQGMSASHQISYIGKTNARPPHRIFGITQADRLSHLYVIGRTGVGKTTLLESLALQDIKQGRGCAIIDPHGDMAERLVAHVPEHRGGDLVYWNTADHTQPYGYNPLRRVHPDKIPLAAGGLMDAFHMLWTSAWGVRMEHILRNVVYALLEYGDATLPDILAMLTSKSFRLDVLRQVQNKQVREFWLREYPHYNPRFRSDAIAPIQNKVGAFLADPRLHHIFTAAPRELHFRQIMDTGKILIVNLAKGRLGPDSANVLGALLITTLSLAAFSRADIPESERRPFFLTVDEFKNLNTLSVASMIAELRKHRVGLTLAHQHLTQLSPDVQHAILGNVGTIISFRLGPADARLLAREFEPKFSAHDLMNLPNHQIYTKLLIDGAPTRPFSATTLPPETVPGI